jgi:hypothetical protein
LVRIAGFEPATRGFSPLQDAKREILGKPKAGVRKHAVEKPSKPRRALPKPFDLEYAPEPSGPAAVSASPAVPIPVA